MELGDAAFKFRCGAMGAMGALDRGFGPQV